MDNNHQVEDEEDGDHRQEDHEVDEEDEEKVSTPMAAAIKSAYCYKRSLHQSPSSNHSDDVAFGVVTDQDHNQQEEEEHQQRQEDNQELSSELSTTSTGSSNSSVQDLNPGNASAVSLANRLNHLQESREPEGKGLSRTMSIQTLPQINTGHVPEGRPKTSVSLNAASVPFDEIPIRTRYSSALSLGHAKSGTSINFDEVDRGIKLEELSPFDAKFTQSLAANLDKEPEREEPRTQRKLQRNATEFLKSPKNFLKRNNRKIFPKITISTTITRSPTKVKLRHASPVLSHFERPKEAYSNCMTQLEDSNWETVMTGLKNFVRLIRHHPEYIDPHIHVMAGILAKHVRNLRSQVSRAACQATEEFFLTHRKQLETEADDLVMTLLHRTADTNKFLRKDATRALESMCDNLTTQKVVHLLSTRGITHQNALVRTTTSYLLSRLVIGLGAEKVYAMNKDSRDRIFLTGAQLLTEGSLETRNHAKQMFRELATHIKYQKVLLEVIPNKLYRHIEKTLKKVDQ